MICPKRNVFLFVFVGLFLMTTKMYSQDPNLYIFLCFGQSNMSGQADYTEADKIVDSRFMVLRAANHSGQTVGEFYPAAPPLGHSACKMGPADFFGRRMIEKLPSEIKIAVTNISIGGQSIKLFDKATCASVIEQGRSINDWWIQYLDQYGGDVYKRIIEMGNVAKQKGVIKGILFHQGEADGSLTDWPQRVKKVYDDIIADLGLNPAEVPMLLGEMLYTNQGGVCGTMNPKVAQAAALIPNGHLISADGCTRMTSDGLNVHFTREGYQLLGQRYADMMLSLLPAVTPGIPTVSITSPTASSVFAAPAAVTITANASDSDGSISLVEFYNGTTKLGEDNTSPYTFSWTNVAAGTYAVTAVATDNSGNKSTSPSVSVKVRGAYSGTPLVVPGTIQFEEFDLGGNNTAYYDNSPGSAVTPVVNFRSSEDVDIENCTDAGGGYNIGYTMAGEWLEYTVNVAASGTYNFTFRVACNGTGRSVSLQSNGVTIANNVSIPNTGGWQVWTNVSLNNVSLTAGVQVLRLTIGSSDYVNLNYMTIEPVVVQVPPTVSFTTPANNSEFAATDIVSLVALASSESGSIANVTFKIGSQVLLTDYTAPYSYDWSGMSAGTYTITAEASDNNGLKTSADVSVTIMEVIEPKTITLKSGWNIIGCPLSGSTDITIALSSVWPEVEVVKNYDNFYLSTNMPTLNLLKTLDWGKGYMVKVKNSCILNWKAQ